MADIASLTASSIVDRIAVGQAEWSELFAPHEFFSSYKYYLQICASAGSPEDQLKWAGTVESKVRQLVMKLENVDTILLAHPFIKSFEQTYHCLSDDECKALAKGEVLPEVAKRTEEEVAGNENLTTAYFTYFFIGLKIDLKPKGVPMSFFFSRALSSQPRLGFRNGSWTYEARHFLPSL